MKYLVFLSLLFSSLCLNAQSVKEFPIPFQITSDTVGRRILDGKYWQLLVDSADHYTFENVKQRGFIQAKAKTQQYGHSPKAVWTRYAIKNSLAHPLIILIPEGAIVGNLLSLTKRAELYASLNGIKWERHLTGKTVPYQDITGYKRAAGFYFSLKPGETYLFYEKLNNDNFGNAGVGVELVKSIPNDLIITYERLLKQTQSAAFLMGFSILAALVSLFFYYNSREKVYLYFSLVIVFNSFDRGDVVLNEVIFNYIPILLPIQNLFGVLVVFFFWLFASNFYQTGVYFPRWTKYTTYLIFLPFLSKISSFLTVAPALVYLLFWINILFAINILLICIASIVKNRKDLIFNALTIFPLLTIKLFDTIVPIFNNKSTILPILSTLATAAFAWMMTMFLYKLIMRYRLLQQQLSNEALEREMLARNAEVEKNRLIESQKVELELQVAERTLELNQSIVDLKETQTQISIEKQRSEDLLLNILPADVAEELKQKGSANARLFEEVTVLFTDFVNFTKVSELLSPQELVDELHTCFKAFDQIMEQYGIEKIKTIGDAYLAVAGLPHYNPMHAIHTIAAGLAITEFINKRKLTLGNKTFDIRIGIHSGEVVAGIVGVKKFAYDIWGDTVNTAARMEQNSEPGKINVSEKTYELCKSGFNFSYRGELAAKNKGLLKMYFVDGIV